MSCGTWWSPANNTREQKQSISGHFRLFYYNHQFSSAFFEFYHFDSSNFEKTHFLQTNRKEQHAGSLLLLQKPGWFPSLGISEYRTLLSFSISEYGQYKKCPQSITPYSRTLHPSPSTIDLFDQLGPTPNIKTTYWFYMILQVT